MKLLAVRYTALVGTLIFLFFNFIACGAQFYQVALDNDVDDRNLISKASKDPESMYYGIHAPRGWKKLPIPYKVDHYMNDDQTNGLKAAMSTWQKVTGKKLFDFQGVHSGVTGDSFKDLFSSLSDEVNGGYLDKNWAKTAKAPVVLATTIWDLDSSDGGGMLVKSDIRFNEEHYVMGDSLKAKATVSREVVDMESLALHELGHLLGLSHIDPTVDAYSVMRASLFIGEGLTTRKISRGDIERIQKIYGCEGRACDVDTMIYEIEYSGIINSGNENDPDQF